MESKTILIVDSRGDTYEQLCRALDQVPAPALARTGKRALQLANQLPILIAFVSHQLTDMPGLRLLSALRAKMPKVPLVLVAETAGSELILAAMRSGANDFLTQGADVDCIAAVFQRLCPEGLLADTTNGRHSIRHALATTSERLRGSLRSWCQSAFTSLRRSLDEVTPIWHAAGPAPVELTLPAEKTNGAAVSPVIHASGDGRNGELPQLAIHCLGGFRVFFKGQPVHAKFSRKARAILVCLAQRHPRHAHRDILMDRFWPDADPDAARNCLHVSLHNVRQQFARIDHEIDVVLFRDECYFINPELSFWLDAGEFDKAWRTGNRIEGEQNMPAAIPHFEKAIALYKGDFMEEDRYECWPAQDRENLREAFLLALNKLSEYHFQRGQTELAIQLCERILARDGCCEDVHRRLMQCYHRLGQRDKAIRQYNKCEELLQNELEVLPSRATNQLLQQIKQEIL